MKLFFSFLSGLLFGAGLIVGGMTHPAKVIGFLDFFGSWDPTLAFVMAGAVGVYAAAVRLIPKMKSPLLADRFFLPTPRPWDKQLVLGAGLFGVGWAVTGMCPGPILAAAGSGALDAFIVLGGVLAGMLVQGRLARAD